MKRAVIYGICLLLFLPFVVFSEPVDSYSIDQKTLPTHASIIYEHGALYLPIQEFLRPLNLSISFSPKLHLYELKSVKTFHRTESGDPAKTSVFFAPFSDFVQYGGKTHYLSHAPILKNGRLYIPINAFTPFTGISAAQKESVLVFKTSPPKFQPDGAYASINGDHFRKLYNNTPIPNLHIQHQAWLQSNKKRIDILSKLIKKNDITYVPLNALCDVLGVTPDVNDTHITLRTPGLTVSLSKHSPQATLYRRGDITYARNQGAPVYKNGRYYVPLESMIRRLDYLFHWDAESRTIQLLSPINHIEYVDSSLVIRGARKISPTIYQKDGRLYFDIPFSTLSDDIHIHAKPRFKSIRAFQVSPTVVRIVAVNPHKIKTGSPQFSNGLTRVPFIETLQQIRHRITGDTYAIIIPSTMKLSPKVTSEKSGSKLIIDIPNSLNLLPSFYADATQPIYSKIRISQFSKSPATSRIVFDLKSERAATLVSDSHELSIRFKLSGQELAEIRRLNSPRNTLRNRTIVLDAGHGGRDPGAIGIYKEKEKVFTYDITLRLKRKLEQEGARVIMARVGDSNPSLQRRTAIANRSRSDIFVSIHVNSFGKSYANGTETYYYKYQDKQLASALQRSMAQKLQLKNNGVKRARLYVLRHSKMPTALVEPAFITNPKENRLVNSPSFREKIADSLLVGIKRYFDKK